MYLLDQFLKYVKYDTASDPFSESTPSSAKQLVLAKELMKDMAALGLSDVQLSDAGVVYGFLPATAGQESAPTIGLIAHMDTSPDITGENVEPRLIENYDGGDIAYPDCAEPLSPSAFPSLKKHIGKTLIVAGGATLLGADDKAGIAEIFDAIRQLNEGNIPHGKIAVAVTPDEEVGRGVDNFDLGIFGADFAYTVDGGDIDDIAFECFNAASLTVTVTGFNIHPGTAKGKMKNASLIAMEFEQMLPEQQKPQYTEGYEGFFHLSSMAGDEEQAVLRYIVRDHSREKFEEKKRLAASVSDYLNVKYGDGTVEIELEDSYYNMREMIEPHIEVVDRAKRAMEKAGIAWTEEAIRGGTDGARLSYMGLPCPNLPTGGYNFHGRFEYIPLEDMQKAVEIIVNILRAQ